MADLVRCGACNRIINKGIQFCPYCGAEFEIAPTPTAPTAPYVAPQAQQPYAAPQAQQPYAPPQAQQQYSPPQAQQPYAPPQAQQQYSPPQAQQPYAPPQAQQPCAPPQAQQPYAASQAQQPYAAPQAQQPYQQPQPQYAAPQVQQPQPQQLPFQQYSWTVSFYTSDQNPQGGKLRVEGYNLVFKPNSFNFGNKDERSLFIPNIISIETDDFNGALVLRTHKGVMRLQTGLLSSTDSEIRQACEMLKAHYMQEHPEFQPGYEGQLATQWPQPEEDTMSVDAEDYYDEEKWYNSTWFRVTCFILAVIIAILRFGLKH